MVFTEARVLVTAHERATFCIEIDRYGFLGADTDILAIPGLIADISKIFKSCFLLRYQKYNVFYALPFFKNLKNQG